jgi:hypothetical protein
MIGLSALALVCRIADTQRTIGSTKLWLPSLRSVESHRGGLSIVLEGHCLFGRSRGLKALYFFEGSLSLETILSAT